MKFRTEADYQEYLVKRIYSLLPGKKFVDTLVIVTDPNYLQGIADLAVMHHSRWALLEVKLTEKSKVRPNQEWYLQNWGQWIFTAFIYPENEEEVLRALQLALGA